MAQLQVENLTEQCLRAISREGLHMGTSGTFWCPTWVLQVFFGAPHVYLSYLLSSGLSSNLWFIFRHINSFGDVEFFGCFVRGVVHGVCWRSLPGNNRFCKYFIHETYSDQILVLIRKQTLIWNPSKVVAFLSPRTTSSRDLWSHFSTRTAGWSL